MIARVLLPLSVLSVILAQSPGVPWENMTALGFLGTTCLWLVMKTLPNMVKDFNNVITTMVKALETQQAQQSQRMHEDSVALTATLSRLQQHCQERLAETKT